MMPNKKYIAISAATFSGNQGAASMLHATIQQLSAKDDVEFSVFTVYPEADKELNEYDNVSVYSATPRRLVLALIPASFLYRHIAGARELLGKVSGVRALAEADLQIDLAGISFADGRRVFLIYNIASVLPALILRKPVVKFSQAMGQFNDIVNRVVASWFLPKFAQIFARGQETRASLDKLNLANVTNASDIAFLFKPTDASRKSADEFRRTNDLKKKAYITVSPSRVLFKKSEKLGIDYVKQMAKYVDWLTKDQGIKVLLIPHSVRKDADKLHNNDLPVCQEIYNALKNKQDCIMSEHALYAGELKQLIADSKIVVAARFHAMISSLSTGTPVVVTGWSHKYQEVLDSFGVSLPAIYLDASFQKNVRKFTQQALAEAKQTEKLLTEKYPKISKQSQEQIKYVAKNFL